MSSRTLHPFPARMAPDIAIDSLARDVAEGQSLTVLDPMCGSGTVLSAAIAAGHNARGLDLDPLAVLMSQVAVTPVDADLLTRAAERVVAGARRLRRTVGPWADEETHAFAEYWFGESQRRQLIRLSAAIDEYGSTHVRRALQVALSRIIVTKEPKASLARDTAHSRPHRVTVESTYDVYAGFLSSVGKVASLLRARKLTGDALVSSGDARSMRAVANGSIDRVVTSPPYLNAIDYMRGHRLALIWLGFSLKELAQIRRCAIGAERALDDAETSKEVRAICDLAADACEYRDLLPKAVMLRYARDLVGFASECHRVVKPDGRVLLVIGNSTLKGNFIQNDLMAQTALTNAGFTLESRTVRDLPENKRYLPLLASQRTTLAKRMRTETILELVRS